MLIEKKALNIKNLVIPEPRQGGKLPFSPERDITEDDWSGVKEYMNEDVQLEFKMVTLADMLSMIPQKRPEFEQALNDIFQQLIEDPDLLLLESVKRLFSDKIDDILKGQPGVFHPFDTLAEQVNTLDKDNWSSGQLIFEIFVIYPERFDELRSNPRVVRENLEERFEKSLYSPEHMDFERALEAAVTLKLLDGHIDISKEQWERMHEMLKADRRGGVYAGFAFTARSMAILSAEDVRMTEEGLQITMPGQTPHFINTPVMPHVRKF